MNVSLGFPTFTCVGTAQNAEADLHKLLIAESTDDDIYGLELP